MQGYGALKVGMLSFQLHIRTEVFYRIKKSYSKFEKLQKEENI
jgi:hypothetical protein